MVTHFWSLHLLDAKSPLHQRRVVCRPQGYLKKCDSSAIKGHQTGVVHFGESELRSRFANKVPCVVRKENNSSCCCCWWWWCWGCWCWCWCRCYC